MEIKTCRISFKHILFPALQSADTGYNHESAKTRVSNFKKVLIQFVQSISKCVGGNKNDVQRRDRQRPDCRPTKKAVRQDKN